MFKDSKQQTKLLGQILVELKGINQHLSNQSAPADSSAGNQTQAKLDQIIVQGVTMAGELDALTSQVQSNTDVVGSAITLIQGIKAALDAAGTDPAKLTALKDALASSDDALAAAVAANTPASTPPTP